MRRHPYETNCEPRSRPRSAIGARGRQSHGRSPTATFTHRAPSTLIAIVVLAMAASLSTGAPSASAAGGHYYSHGGLHCDPDRGLVGVTYGMTSSVQAGESVRLSHSLYRWTTGGWVLDSARKPVRSYPTSNPYVSTWASEWQVRWYFFDGTYDTAQGMPLWRRAPGNHYAIVESIIWFNAAGTVVDQHDRTLTRSAGYYCSL